MADGASSGWWQIPARSRPSWCRPASSSRPSKFSRWGMSFPTENSTISCGLTGRAAVRPGREATRVRLRCDHFFGRYRRAAATIAPATASTSSVFRASPPKMTSATPLSTTTASAFRPGPRKCRRVAGCRGGSLVSMLFTSTNTGSNCVWFTPYHWRTRCKGAAARPPVAGTEQRDSPGPVSGVASGRHPVAADQPGAGRGSACSWRPTLPSAAFLAAVEDPPAQDEGHGLTFGTGRVTANLSTPIATPPTNQGALQTEAPTTGPLVTGGVNIR